MSSDRAADIVAASRPIPTPLRVRWSLFRSRWLPVMTMGVCAILSGWMWTRVAAIGQAIGEVERVRVDSSSVAEGRLDYISGKQIALLQHVEEGDIVAKIDDSQLQVQISGAQAELKLLQEQLKAATAPSAAPALAEQAGALRVAITAKEAHLSQLDGRLDSLVVKAPISGTVSTIYARPGQFVQAGLPIMEIASERGTSIVAYLKAEQRIVPREGMEVEVRTSSDPYRAYASKVESVSGQYNAIPTRLLRDPKMPEWGIPVRVTLPPDASVRPGELVRVMFRSRPSPLTSNAVAVAVADEAGGTKAHADASR